LTEEAWTREPAQTKEDVVWSIFAVEQVSDTPDSQHRNHESGERHVKPYRRIYQQQH